jgi:hypothetical protein
LRLDRTAGETLRVAAQPISLPTTQVRLTNQIESVVQLNKLRITAAGPGPSVGTPVEISGLPADSRLKPGESCDLTVQFSSPPDPETVLVVDQSQVLSEPDRNAIWNLVFDARSEENLTREIKVHAPPSMFVSPDRPDDSV